MSKHIKDLERRAADAHRAGQTWNQFWDEHGDAIGLAEPYHRGRYHRLVRRLLALLTSGEPEQRTVPTGMLWGDTCPWEVDDCAEVAG